MADELNIDTPPVDTPPPESKGGIGSGIPAIPSAASPELDYNSESTYQAFRATLPEDLREKAFFKETKSLKALAEQAINAQSALGKKRLAAPQEDWTDADYADFYSKLRPETLDGYQASEKITVTREGQDAKEIALPPEATGRLREIAHSLGLTQNQYSKFEKAYAEQQLSTEEIFSTQTNKYVEDLTNELRKDWGNDFAINHRSANEAYQALVAQVPELEALMSWSPVVANHPATMKLFHALAPLVKDMGMGNQGNASGFGNDTVAGLKSQISDFDAEHRDILFASADKLATLTPTDKAKRERLLSQRTQMYQKLYPTKQ